MGYQEFDEGVSLGAKYTDDRMSHMWKHGFAEVKLREELGWIEYPYIQEVENNPTPIKVAGIFIGMAGETIINYVKHPIKTFVSYGLSIGSDK